MRQLLLTLLQCSVFVTRGSWQVTNSCHLASRLISSTLDMLAVLLTEVRRLLMSS
jgi:hypothetical protein